MANTKKPHGTTIAKDVTAAVVVFLVALPLCLGIALASNAPLFSGVLAGIVGGIVVGILSGSHTSVAGPAAGLTAVVAAQIIALGSFQIFLLAVLIAGILQIITGLLRGGFIAMFVPTSVIKGLLSAIGVLLILKQIPHLVGHDSDPEGDLSFQQPDDQTTFSELLTLFEGQWHVGAAVIGILSIVILVAWERLPFLKKSPVPAPLIVVVAGVMLGQLFAQWGGQWIIGTSHLVQVPVAESPSEFAQYLMLPDFSQWLNPQVYLAALTIAIVASLETLLNLEAVDRLDPQQRHSPPNRELIAQGVGNVACGLIGGIPVTSVIIRSSVNIHSGGQTKLSAILHGFLLVGCVMFVPQMLNMIPLASLAGILLVTGFKLASPQLMKQMYRGGVQQFIPYIVTVLAIVFTDLLIGIVIGLIVAVSFILYSSLKQPVHRVRETHVGGNVLRIELANQVSFLNRAALEQALNEIQSDEHVLIDATMTSYIDPDVLGLLREFRSKTAPARGVKVSLRGFREKYDLQDEIQFIDYSTRELQKQLSPDDVLDILRSGNERFRSGKRLTRNLERQIHAAAEGQHPLAVVLSCMDSRAPVETIFDVGIGDLFSIRVAGNVIGRKLLASIEYGCVIASSPLVLVMGHTRCGAVGATVQATCGTRGSFDDVGCQHISHIVDAIKDSIDPDCGRRFQNAPEALQQELIDQVCRRNVQRSVALILEQSEAIKQQVQFGNAAVVGAMYDVTSGQIEFLDQRTYAE